MIGFIKMDDDLHYVVSHAPPDTKTSKVNPVGIDCNFSGFSCVDRDPHSSVLIDYLDFVHSQPVVKEYKNQSFELLNIHSGDLLLDAGCGTGIDATELAHLVGPIGKVIGIDNSEKMIETATQRMQESSLSVEFKNQDVYKLCFSDNTFHGVRAERLFQHLEFPNKALNELIRVTRPGGRIVVTDPDWQTLLIDSIDQEEITSVITEQQNYSILNDKIGRNLRRLFKEGGLIDVEVTPHPLIFTDFSIADALLTLTRAAKEAAISKKITENQAEMWLQGVKQSSEQGTFFSSLTLFSVCGVKRLCR